MFKKMLAIFLISFILPSLASAAILDANVVRGRTDVGICLGGFFNGADLEYGVSDNLSVGVDYVSADLTLVPIILLMKALGDDGNWYGSIYDVHVNWQIHKGVEGDPINVSLIGGVGGTEMRKDSSVEESHTIAVGGMCISLPAFHKNLILRLNLVAGPPFGGELAWKLSDNFEVSLGVTAMGIFGVKLSF